MNASLTAGTISTPWATSFTIMPLPPDAEGRVSYAPVIPSHLSRWYELGKTDSEVLDMLRGLPGTESIDFSGVMTRTHERLETKGFKLERERDDLQKDVQCLLNYCHEFEGPDPRPELELPVEEGKLPAFPQFSGALHDLAVALCPDLPYEFKFVAAATYFGLIRSGLDKLAGEPNYQTRFYTCFIGKPKTGKTASIKEVSTWMETLKPAAAGWSLSAHDSVDSGPALVDDFADLKKLWSANDSRLRILLSVDEMKDLFEKSKVTAGSRNSLSNEMLKLFEGNKTSNRARHANKGKRIEVENAHLAILGGATEEGYGLMWTGTGGGVNGLQSRFIPLVTDNPPLGIERRPSDTEAVSAAIQKLKVIMDKPGQEIHLDQEGQQVLKSWWDRYLAWDPDRSSFISRVDDIVKRLIILLAVTNGVVLAGKDIVESATAFGDYVIAVREKFNPEDSYTWTQAFENGIVAVFKKYPNRSFTMNDMRRLVNADRKPGGLQSFLQAWKNCIQAQVLEQAGLNRKGSMQYRLA